MTWTITRWYQAGRPSDGRLVATLGEVAYGLYGRRTGGMQYALLREALDRLFNVSLDLTVLTIEDGHERWLASKRRRIIQELSIHEPMAASVDKSSSTLEIRLGSWLVDQLDAQTVAAIAWQVLRGLSGIAKRLAIYLAAHAAEFAPITQHTERFTVNLTEELTRSSGSLPRGSAIAGHRYRARRHASWSRIRATPDCSWSAPVGSTFSGLSGRSPGTSCRSVAGSSTPLSPERL